MSNLIVSYLFPPSHDISGIVVAKRIITDDEKVDVLTTIENSSEDLFSCLVNEYVDERFVVNVNFPRDSPKAIKEFVDNSFKIINKDYKTIFSRSWSLANHFFAFEYKLRHPDIFWRAEFSDPLLHDINNTVNKKAIHKIDDPGYFDRINEKILEKGFPKLENLSSTFFTAEYLTFLFADEIIFTNENQREVMISQFRIDVREIVMEKSIISPHPTLPQEYYHKSKTKVSLDDEFINLAYFGDYYYGKRHFEAIFFALESLNHKFKNKIRFYIFISNEKLLRDLTKNLDFSKNIFIKKPLDYLDFLNASTNFNVLIVNDSITDDVWSKNPYLPSKLSDYNGSGSDIWAISEEGSALDKLNIKYKSRIDDYCSNVDVLVKILDDYGFDDKNFSVSSDYFEKRLTYLNQLIERYYNISKLEKSKNTDSKESLVKKVINKLH